MKCENEECSNKAETVQIVNSDVQETVCLCSNCANFPEPRIIFVGETDMKGRQQIVIPGRDSQMRIGIVFLEEEWNTFYEQM